MSIAAVIRAMALPTESLVEQRVPKKMLSEQGAPTAADRRAIQEGVEELFWVAALKPTNVGVPAFRDVAREYLEIAVLTAAFRQGAKASRLVELVHRAIPYPVVLISASSASPRETLFSVAHKRWSQGETGKVVIEDVHSTSPLHHEAGDPTVLAFLGSLAVALLPRGNLFALYQGWVDRVSALEAGRITGAFVIPGASDQGGAVRDQLESHKALERELVLLRARAKREKQINRRVDLNLEIKRLEAEMAAIRKRL